MMRGVTLPCLTAAVIGLAAVLVLPAMVELYTLINATVYASMALFALSMALIWGQGGILCFGQAAFFGLGAYAYAVTAINLGDSTFAVLASLLVPMLFAAALGYFVFYGRLTDVYFGVITLTVTLIWGQGGILCFGQAAFFGLGAYAYAVTAINLGDSTFAVLASLLVPMLFAAAVGYFVFYGRLTDVYFGVITLTVTLILFKLVNSTGGDAYRIGKARLGGFNGMPDTPPLNFPFDPAWVLTPRELYTGAVVALTLGYILCKWLTVTRFGRLVAAVRENEVRAELLGYDARLLKLAIFAIGAGIAGFAGMIFATSVFVSPTVFGLSTTAQVLIWVVVGGVGTLAGPIIASVVLQMITATLGAGGWIDPNIVLGVILIGFVLAFPRGLLPVVTERLRWFRDRGDVP